MGIIALIPSSSHMRETATRRLRGPESETHNLLGIKPSSDGAHRRRHQEQRQQDCDDSRPGCESHALALMSHVAQGILSLRVTLLGSSAIPLDRLGVVLRHPQAPLIHVANSVLGIRVLLFGGLARPAESFGIVLRYA